MSKSMYWQSHIDKECTWIGNVLGKGPNVAVKEVVHRDQLIEVHIQQEVLKHFFVSHFNYMILVML